MKDKKGHGSNKKPEHGHQMASDRATFGRFNYNPVSVDKAIRQSERRGGKVSGKERSAIHRLLRGRG